MRTAVEYSDVKLRLDSGHCTRQGHPGAIRPQITLASLQWGPTVLPTPNKGGGPLPLYCNLQQFSTKGQAYIYIYIYTVGLTEFKIEMSQVYATCPLQHFFSSRSVLLKDIHAVSCSTPYFQRSGNRGDAL